MGLVRLRVFSHYFGLRSDAADAFNAAFRIPNFLQNLFGEGVLSASFIPVYANLLARGEEEEAGRVAGAVAAVLSLVVSVLVLAGVLATPWLIDAIAPGFEGAKRELAIPLVRVLFPGAGLLVLSAWCLGILNSHRRFFLSYTAPVIWNAAMIATLARFRRPRGPRAAGRVAGVGLGSGQRAAVPGAVARRAAPGARAARAPGYPLAARARSHPQLRAGLRRPRRGADQRLRGRAAGEPAAHRRRHRPVQRADPLHAPGEPVRHVGFGGGAARHVERARRRATRWRNTCARVSTSGLARIAFFIVPSAVAFLALGDVLAGALLQTGRFTHADSVYVWGILAGAGVGLLPGTLGRLYSSHLLRAARHPHAPALRRSYAWRLATGLGYLAAVRVPGWIGIDARWGVAGLTAASVGGRPSSSSACCATP